MIIKTRFIRYCWVAGFAAVVASAPAASGHTVAAKDGAQAVALEQKANSWLGTPSKWRSMARALERAAEIRGQNDPRAVEDLMLAGSARFSARDLLRARATFVQAADWALTMGDVEAAATGFIRGAAVSIELKDAESALALRDKAQRLTLSPLLSETQRAAIRSHFAAAAEGAAER